MKVLILIHVNCVALFESVQWHPSCQKMHHKLIHCWHYIYMS